MTNIDLQGLTKRYGPDTVVDDVSFTVEPGQVTGFLAPNGAGKSTTMKMMSVWPPRPRVRSRSATGITVTCPHR
ncbi:ABC transporter family protein [Amycolatopsis cihanbeyliensis]|uniref:ABC transporter family protein n=1 Tax=Amycolatopsis cihanbeyliensis TaxID=1128664 RepID=A0A542DE28_AMYCI|nr:ABC transporter family protein [Amycolatopsis cihanbeyliensis]